MRRQTLARRLLALSSIHVSFSYTRTGRASSSATPPSSSRAGPSLLTTATTQPRRPLPLLSLPPKCYASWRSIRCGGASSSVRTACRLPPAASMLYPSPPNLLYSHLRTYTTNHQSQPRPTNTPWRGARSRAGHGTMGPLKNIAPSSASSTRGRRAPQGRRTTAGACACALDCLIVVGLSHHKKGM